MVIVYVLNNNFFYTQVASAYIPYNTDALLFSFFSKTLMSFSGL